MITSTIRFTPFWTTCKTYLLIIIINIITIDIIIKIIRYDKQIYMYNLLKDNQQKENKNILVKQTYYIKALQITSLYNEIITHFEYILNKNPLFMCSNSISMSNVSHTQNNKFHWKYFTRGFEGVPRKGANHLLTDGHSADDVCVKQQKLYLTAMQITSGITTVAVRTHTGTVFSSIYILLLLKTTGDGQ